MKVSYYELLGMIKENKQPNKVIYSDNIYTFNGNDYKKNDGGYITDIMYEIRMFNKSITILEPSEIIEEDKEIEEIPLKYTENKIQSEIYEYLRCVINEVIRKVNKIGKEGK